MQTYTRRAERQGRLPLRTKLAQAIGAFPIQALDWSFATFLLLFYNQVLGLPAGLASLALTIAVISDAITDPAVGSFSDGLVSRFGRRHPLMYGAVVPLAVVILALFSPPEQLGNIGLFAWLVTFAVGVRVALTFFAVPWAALFPELTDDYAERSEILAYRWTIGIASVAGFQAITWGLIFTESGDQVGQLVRSNYVSFALVLALLVAGIAALSTVLTHREIRFLRQPTQIRQFSILTILSDLRDALTCRNFLILFVAFLISNTFLGTVSALRIYAYTFFWGLSSADLKYFAFAAIGAFFALGLIPQLSKRFEKRNILVLGIVVNLLDNSAIVSLRFLGLLPENGDPLLVTILVMNEVLHAFLTVIIATMFYSMVADTVDEQELRMGSRQEGVFSAAIGFSSKAISGFGVLTAGLILQFYIGIPEDVRTDAVPGDVVNRIGFVMGYGLPFLYFIPAAVVWRYNLSRNRHAEILTQLADRKGVSEQALPIKGS